MNNSMLENFTWDFFKNTGDIEAFLEYTKIRDLNKDDKGFLNDGNDN